MKIEYRLIESRQSPSTLFAILAPRGGGAPVQRLCAWIGVWEIWYDGMMYGEIEAPCMAPDDPYPIQRRREFIAYMTDGEHPYHMH